MLFVWIMLFCFFSLICANAFFSCFVFVYFIFFICIMHSAFNLFVFPNYMFTSLLLLFFIKLFFFQYFLWKGYELSGEIALKNNHYYYYYYGRTSTLQHNVADDLRSINCDVTSISGMTKSCFVNLVDTLDWFMFNVYIYILTLLLCILTYLCSLTTYLAPHINAFFWYIVNMFLPTIHLSVHW